MKALASVFLVSSLTFVSLPAATVVPPGALLGTQIWTAANSPYVIAGDVTVGTSGRLFIEAGAEVQFSSTDSASAGVDTNRCELRVLSGLLVVSGTKTNPVIFRAISNSLPSTWYGITVTNGLGAFVTNAWIQDAFTGFASDSTNLCVLDHVTLCSNRTGAYIGRANTNSPAILNGLRVFQNTNGVVVNGFAPNYVRNSAVYSNFTHGIVAGRATILNCTVQGNGFGVRCIASFDDDLQVINCLLTSNDVAILQYMVPEGGFARSVRIKTVNCAYWGNNGNLYEFPPGGSTTGSNAVFGDPRYLNLPGADGVIGTADDDFRLAAGSACIDQGDNSAALPGTSIDFNSEPRRVDDPATVDFAGLNNFAPIVDIGACEFQLPLRILLLRRSGANVDVTVPAVPGPLYYWLQYTHDFAGWTNWGTSFKGDGLVHTQRDANVTSPLRFYRVQGFP